jgi:ligand-binding sensor domain-containing protein/serine phosphatase RsbU (regulator of sigma subunit)
MKGLILWIAMLFGTTSLLSQQVTFRNLSQRDGLSQSSVHAIVRDKTGYIWFGTEDGLNRYDGLRFTVYKDDPSKRRKDALSDRSILSLYVHDDGSLWVGTQYGGLCRYDAVRDNFTVYRFDSTSKAALSGDQVHAIARADEGHIWVGTDGGLDLVDVRTGRAQHFLGADASGVPRVVRCIQADKGVLWAGTHGAGLVRIDIGSKKERTYVPADEQVSDPRYGKRVRSLVRDTKGKLWVGFDGAGLALLDEKTGGFTFFSESDGGSAPVGSRVAALYCDHRGDVWAGTDAGLNMYHPESQTFQFFTSNEDDKTSLSAPYVQAINEDDAHSVWVGTAGGGVSAWHRTLGRFNRFRYESDKAFSLPGNTVFAMEEDGNERIWVGLIGEGLACVDFARQRVQQFDAERNKTHNKVLCLERARTGKIWFGTWGGGFNWVNPTTMEFGEPVTKDGDQGLLNNTVLDIGEDGKGNLWIATFRGLGYYDLTRDTIITYDTDYTFNGKDGDNMLLASQVNSLFLDRKNGELWIATEGGGLARLQVDAMVLRVWTVDDGLANNSVYHICGDEKRGGVWVATKTGLCFVDRKDGKVRSWHESDGLQSDYVVGITVDSNGEVWLSTNKGLIRFQPGDEPRIRNYTEDDGLQGSEFNQGAVLQTRKGELFFGGISGLNHFFPDQIEDNPHKPLVVVTAFNVFGKTFELDSSIWTTRHIELSWRQNFFSFEFAALDFVLPHKNLYRYKMLNYDEDWSVPLNRPFASYTGLPGGDYVLMVEATNNDGVWSGKPALIHITIVPPFWKTTTFYVLVSVASVLLLFLLYRWRLNKIKREKRVLEEKVTERTRELAERTEELAEKNKDIMDSIHYAKRIQKAILPEKKTMSTQLDHFVLYLPKDVVSGDFYWFGMRNGWHIVAAVDCTGHGVPGAFMSMIGSNLLHQIVNEKGISEPGKILGHLNAGVLQALKQGTESQETNDGMDVAMIAVSEDRRSLMYAGAFRPLYLVRNNEFLKWDGNKYPIGGSHVELNRTFDTQTIEVQPGDVFYMSTDGYADQFGGPKGKKFMGKKFQELLLSISALPMDDQQQVLFNTHQEWCGDIEQNDDICVIGVRI